MMELKLSTEYGIRICQSRRLQYWAVLLISGSNPALTFYIWDMYMELQFYNWVYAIVVANAVEERSNVVTLPENFCFC